VIVVEVYLRGLRFFPFIIIPPVAHAHSFITDNI
jgi:hypothetical protein